MVASNPRRPTASQASLVRIVASKELRELVRDGRLRLLGVIVFVLALAGLVFGVQQSERAEHARAHAQHRAAKQWQGQGKKNPHVAAHYGTYVFAPSSVATAIDPGVSAYLGRSVKIEAHQRNLASHSAAQDSAGMQRLGSFSVATVLLQLLPLLIIALGYGAWSRERERGTLRQLLSTGVDRRWLLLGKASALFIIVAGLLVPAGLIILAVLWWLGGGDLGTIGRLAFLALGYSVYFCVIGGVTLYASAAARSSRAALVAMIGVWGMFCLAAPRAASEVAGAVAPLPSQAQLAREVADSLQRGIDGKAERETAIDAITADSAAGQGIAHRDLPQFDCRDVGKDRAGAREGSSAAREDGGIDSAHRLSSVALDDTGSFLIRRSAPDSAHICAKRSWCWGGRAPLPCSSYISPGHSCTLGVSRTRIKAVAMTAGSPQSRARRSPPPQSVDFLEEAGKRSQRRILS